VSTVLRIGTRASQLALWQAEYLRTLIVAHPGAPAVELVHIRTQGDQQRDVPLWRVGGQAFFTREIDAALAAGEIDIAVHSLKDLPTRLEPGIALTATLERADPRDALVSRDGQPLAQLPQGARIGTSSLRRRAFLARARPDAELIDLRGNVPTRVARLKAGDYDAIVLAAAGLTRLGLVAAITEYLAPEQFPPAVSQGIIGVCARSDDAVALKWLTPLDDLDARLAALAERTLLRRIEGGCQVPLGALATVSDGRVRLEASVCALDGSRSLTAHDASEATPAAAQMLGERVAEALLAQGAAELIAAERGALAVEAP
jgi:hydroxymethylbilane synthase